MTGLHPELRGKVALVTGGNTGIGEAIVRAFAAQGSLVAVVGGPRLDAAERVAASIRSSGGDAVGLAGDLTRGPEVQRVVGAAVERLGGIDVLVNCAGGFPARCLTVDMDEAVWDDVVALNLKTAFLCSKAVLPGMVERRWGRIVNIASEAGRFPADVTSAAYAAGKAGLLGFTRHLAREVAPFGVTVNATAPGTTYSDRVRGLMTPESERRTISITPLGRIGTVDDQAGDVLFLASDAARYVTGATIPVSGGRVLA